ncbi:NUDIX domain [Geosmithia morbida]|uniref:NUDIX domain n=1 Tax=Geosmithia morbida TaxID=1094350 RepID=A0A9P4YX95_9HYPO|nr:NUDIX domain [Geosmithia morbida]KAF4123474.1 NUDIX domain [Geosmithia morbida]
MAPWQMKPLPPCPPPERQHRHTPIPSVAGHRRRSSFPTGRQTVHKTHQLTGCDVDVQQYDGPLLSPRRRRAKIGFSDRWVAWDYHHFATELAACRAPTSSSSASWSSEAAAAAASDNYYHHRHHHRHNHMYSGPPPSLKQSTASSYSSRSYPGQGSRGNNGTIGGDDDGQATCGYPSRRDGTQRPSLGSAFGSDSGDGGGDDFGRIIGSIRGLVGGVAASTTMRIKRWSRGPLTRLHSSPTPSPLGVVCEGVISTAGNIEAVQAAVREALEASSYYDASTMAPLSPSSAIAISRLRAYRPPPFPLWDKLPARKRAAVLILLYADRWGDLRVVITMRAASLRSFSGHAALPGGKADSTQETPYQIARREASEEIGLPLDDRNLPKPFRVEQLCCLPPSLARTHLVVTPCVAFLHADRTADTVAADGTGGDGGGRRGGGVGGVEGVGGESDEVRVQESMMPHLDAREVAALFSAPLYNFLRDRDLPPPAGSGQTLPDGPFYDGYWKEFKDYPWRVHNFYVPVNNQRVIKPRRRRQSSAASAAATTTPAQAQDGAGAQEALADKLDEGGRFKVWGMTARILVDAARIAYGEEPDMEHNDSFGDADIILAAEKEGVLRDDPGRGKM